MAYAANTAFFYLSTTRAIKLLRFVEDNNLKRENCFKDKRQSGKLEGVGSRYLAFPSKLHRLHLGQVYNQSQINDCRVKLGLLCTWSLFDSYITKASTYEITSTYFINPLILLEKTFKKMENKWAYIVSLSQVSYLCKEWEFGHLFVDAYTILL